MIISALVLAAALVQSAPDTDKIVDMRASPHELYISCGLAMSGERMTEEKTGPQYKPHAPATCVIMSVMALNVSKKEQNGSPLKFCPSGAADFSANSVKALEFTYIEFFEKNASALSKVDGLAAMVAAYVDKWPCK